MAKRITTEEFINKAHELYGNLYDYSKTDCENRDEKGRVCIICHKLDKNGKEHGEFWQRPYSHLSGMKCKKCADEETGKLNSKKFAKTTEQFIKEATEVHGNKYSYENVNYVNSHTLVNITCKIHGGFMQSPTNHLQGKGCPKCANKNVTSGEFIEKARKVHGNKYDYSKVNYVNNSTKVCIICPEHGEFWQTPNDHLNGCGCSICGLKLQTEKRTMTLSEFIKRARIVRGDKYDYSHVDYINATTCVDIICKKHGLFKQTPYLHLSGCNCKKCSTFISSPETEIANYIASLIGEENIIKNDRNCLNGKEIDIYIPSLKIGFEYDGLYWHSEAGGKFQNYHLNKTELAESKGVRLIHIFEDEWIEHKDIVLNKIKHILNKDTSTIIGARKCEVNNITSKQAKQFLDKFHIQGFVNSTIYYGSFYNNELVGVMSFKKENSDEWNLTRFATNFNYRLPGLANKLFKSFIKNNSPQKVKTFLDRRWGNAVNNVYNKLNFVLDKIEKPDYSYVKGNRRYHKFGFRKQKLNKLYNLPLSMTEKEMCDKLGFERIWNCGLYKYVWRNSQQN